MLRTFTARDGPLHRVLEVLTLAVPDVVAIRLWATVPLRPGEERLDDVGHARRGRFGSLWTDGSDLVELLLGALLVFAALGTADFLPAERDHPLPDVFTKPDLVRAGHVSQTFRVSKPLGTPKAQTHKIWHSNGPGWAGFDTEFSTGRRSRRS